MRTWGIPLLALLYSLSLAAQESTTSTPALHLDGLQIPAELTKAIKAEKANAGDEVHLRMAEPILAGQGLVIPENAKLHGLVLRASAAEKGAHSRISVLVDRVEWKGHVLPLHAFISGFGVRRSVQNNMVDCISRPTAPATPPKGHRYPMPQTYSPDAQVDDCAGTSDRDLALERSRAKMFSEIQMIRNPLDGQTVLVSKKNIHLPGGLLLVLRNDEEAPLTAKK